MNTTTTNHKAHDLKPGDCITFDFRGQANHLGAVEVFDAYPKGRTTLLLLLAASGKVHHRTVDSDTVFACA